MFFALLIVNIYFFVILSFVYGWLRLPLEPASADEASHLFLSVVVPFCDEAPNLPALLECCSAQTHTAFELILVNDHSTDAFLPIVEAYRAKLSNVKLIQATFYGKKNALKQGIEQASGSLIVCTDADCRPSPRWLQSVAQCRQKTNADLIIGPVKMRDGNNFFPRMQALEFVSLIASGAGAAALGKPILCNGANLAFTKQAWTAAYGQLHEEEPSGDDMFLLMALKRRGGKIVFLKSKEAIVETRPCSTLSEFINQRKRWASKSKAYTDLQVLSVGLLVFLVCLLEIVCFGFAFFNPSFGLLLACLWGMKTLADALLLIASSSFFGTRRLLKYIPLLALIYPFYVLASVVGGWVGAYTWKGH